MLGITRSAVWKAIESLRDQGHVIEGIPNKGYRLLTATTLMTRQGLQKLLPNWDVHLFDSLDSTNRYAKVLASEQPQKPTLVVALHQSGGRGRLGRSFFSPKGGLYMSLVLPTTFNMEGAMLVTSIAAVAVAAAIEEICGKHCLIKWVNDLYLDGKKVCGILTEGVLAVESGHLSSVVVGIGINYCTPHSAFPDDLKEIVTSLFDGPAAIPPALDSEQLVAKIVSGLEGLVKTLPDRSFLSFYRERSFLTNKDVVVHQGNETYPAKVMGIDDDAHLVVRDRSSTLHTLSTGEVTIRLEV